MNNQGSLNADWISPPGKSLFDFMQSNGKSLTDFTKELNCKVKFIERFIEGKEDLSPNLAVALSKLTGAPTSFWLKREAQYRASLPAATKRLENQKAWVAALPVADMVNFGWISQAKEFRDKLLNCFNFFGVSSLEEWQQNYGKVVAETAFRTSDRFSHKTESVTAWLRQGQLISESIPTEAWNSIKLTETLPALRELSNIDKPAMFIPKLIKLLSQCGVALSIVRTPKNCPASGATYRINDSKALIILSFRYLTDDHFWFTLFHEIGHLILHPDHSLILESAEETFSQMETEANFFAERTLIPSEFQHEFSQLDSKNLRKLLKFAKKIGIAKGIVVGQMQHKSIIPRSALNNLKVRYSWNDIQPLK